TANGQSSLSKPKKPVEPFPILAWSTIPAGYATQERYREMADAGFTHSLASASSAEDAIKQLDLAKATGLKLIVSCNDLATAKPKAVQIVQDHPAFAGYSLRDEPPVADFAE